MLMVIGKIFTVCLDFKEEGIDYEAETDPVVEIPSTKNMAIYRGCDHKVWRSSGQYVIKRWSSGRISMCK